MNILLAGRLGRYADRILALRDLGHTLVYCTLPPTGQRPRPDDLGDRGVPCFTLNRDAVRAQVDRIIDRYEIDVVYSMKNVWDGSIELVSALLDSGAAPVVRHYKEHFCQPSDAERRTLTQTAGQIYINQESFDYFCETYRVPEDTAHILDTDYLPARYMTDELRPKLYGANHEPHLLVSGGVSVTGGRNDVRQLCADMIRRRVHVHIYGMKFVGFNSAGVWAIDNEEANNHYRSLTDSGYVHLHQPIDPLRFTAEWSVYDAGLMHVTAADTHDAPFQRMNHPNRLSTNLAAGLPLAQQAGGHTAMERLLRDTGVGLLYRDFDELADQLYDRALIADVTRCAQEARHQFTFERHAGTLADIISRYVINLPILYSYSATIRSDLGYAHETWRLGS
jgi:hypothetical protein